LEPAEIIYRTTFILTLYASAIHIASYRKGQYYVHYLFVGISMTLRYFTLVENTGSTQGQITFHFLFALVLATIGLLVIQVIVAFYTDLIEVIQKQEKEKINALTNVIEGFIPICANCKSIRNEIENWIPVEKFILEKSKNVNFSHGLCPKCLDKLYPGFID
jgi:hypothetical protein